MDNNQIDSLENVKQLGTIGYYSPDEAGINDGVYVSCTYNPCAIEESLNGM